MIKKLWQTDFAKIHLPDIIYLNIGEFLYDMDSPNLNTAEGLSFFDQYEEEKSGKWEKVLEGISKSNERLRSVEKYNSDREIISFLMIKCAIIT